MLFILFQFICWWAGALPRPCWLAGQKQRQNNNASPDMNITHHKNISTLARFICSLLGFTLQITGSRSIIRHYSNTCGENRRTFFACSDLSFTNSFLISIWYLISRSRIILISIWPGTIAKLLKLRSVFVKQPQSLVSAEPSNSQSWNSQALIGKSKHCSTCEPKWITASLHHAVPPHTA